MKPALNLRLNQQLALTPQLQQAIRLLQLSSIELEVELREALESNPLLELSEPNAQEDTANGADNGAAPLEADGGGEVAVNGSSEEAPPAREELDYAEPMDFGLERFDYGGPAPDDADGMESQDQEPEDLRDHLLWQLNLTQLS